MTYKNNPEQITLSPEQARQGEIILRTRTQRIIFGGGLIAVLVLAFMAPFIHMP